MRKFFRRLRVFPDKNYLKSNSIDYVRVVQRQDLSYLFVDLDLALKSESLDRIRLVSQSILDKLCELTGVTAEVSVSVGESCKSQMGYVRMNRGKRHSVRLYCRTPKLKRMRSTKVFLNTLLHEFVHIYDWDKLRLSNSVHCSGFYKRIGFLQDFFYSVE